MYLHVRKVATWGNTVADQGGLGFETNPMECDVRVKKLQESKPSCGGGVQSG
jgi:hypothetical protein